MAAGVYGFTLPATPPKGTGRSVGEAFGLPALGLFRDRSFVVFMAVAFVLSVTNQFYGVHAHRFFTERGLDHPERWIQTGKWRTASNSKLAAETVFLLPLWEKVA